MWLSLLPWGFLVLGLLPLWLFPRQENLYPGVIFLFAAVLLAATASLFARISIKGNGRFYFVTGLGVLANVIGVEAARDLAHVPNEIATAAAVASMIASGVLLAGLYSMLQAEGSNAGAGKGLKVSGGSRDILSYSALQSLAPSLESISSVRPVTLLLLHLRSDEPSEDLLSYIRQPDMIFQLKPNQFLIALQGSSPEGAQAVFRRIRQNLVIRAYGVLPLQGSTVEQALEQLEGELAHYYLTQH